MWTMTDSPLNAPNEPTDITVHFEKGIPTKVVTPEKTYTDSVELFTALNKLGCIHGIGRIDIVENRFIGLKSRGCYDSPAMTILRLAHLDLEGLVLDGKVRSLRDQFVTHNWSEQLYNGMYFSPEREFVESALVFAQKRVNGEVRLRLYKGNAYVLGRASKTEKLYSAELASMDTITDFSPEDTRYVYFTHYPPFLATTSVFVVLACVCRVYYVFAAAAPTCLVCYEQKADKRPYLQRIHRHPGYPAEGLWHPKGRGGREPHPRQVRCCVSGTMATCGRTSRGQARNLSGTRAGVLIVDKTGVSLAKERTR